MIQTLTIGNIRVAMCPLATDVPHTEARRQAADTLVAAIADGNRLHHRPDGAPYLDNSTLHVTVTHTRRLAAVAVAPHPVGIDIEDERPRLAEVAARITTSADVALPTALHTWTAKEAAFKCAAALPQPPTVISAVTVTADNTATCCGMAMSLYFRPLGSSTLLCLAFPQNLHALIFGSDNIFS